MRATTTILVNGPAIRALRIAGGYDVDSFSEAADLSRPYITKLELGHSQGCRPPAFGRIVAALGLVDRRAILANPYGEGS